MKKFTPIQFRSILWLLLIALIVPVSAQAETWTLAVGAQSPDKARQALAFLPNEVWIHAGDTITWTVNADEIHTITFLTAAQVRLPAAVERADFPLAWRRSTAQPALVRHQWSRDRRSR